MEGFVMFALKCFYLMLPAYFANMAPVIVKKINFLTYPMDFNLTLGGKPLLGENKTFRGLFFGILFSTAISFVQSLLYVNAAFESISFMDYSNWALIGFLMGFGALVGDMVKSFFKRRIGIKAGDRFIPFDQTDFVFGAIISIMPIFDVTLKIFVTCLLLSFILHIIVNHTAFFLGIRKERW